MAAVSAAVVGLRMILLAVTVGHCSAFGGSCPADRPPLLEDDVFGMSAIGAALVAGPLLALWRRPHRWSIAVGGALAAAVLVGFLVRSAAHGERRSTGDGAVSLGEDLGDLVPVDVAGEQYPDPATTTDWRAEEPFGVVVDELLLRSGRCRTGEGWLGAVVSVGPELNPAPATQPARPIPAGCLAPPGR